MCRLFKNDSKMGHNLAKNGVTIKFVELVGHIVCQDMNKIGALNLKEKNSKNPSHEPRLVVVPQFSFLSFRSKRVRTFSPILQKYYSFGDYFSFETPLFSAFKHLKIFDTSIFSKTEVFSQYFKNT
jgi:hypothetical protein